jgi:hypothetical protein
MIQEGIDKEAAEAKQAAQAKVFTHLLNIL